MTNVIRVLIFSAGIPLIVASQADACWLCWKHDHSSRSASTHGPTGGGSYGGGSGASGGGLPVNTESAAMPESGGLPTPTRVSAPPDAGSGAPAAGSGEPSGAGTVASPRVASYTAPSETSAKLDKMSSQLDRIEKELASPESAGAGTPESAIATMLFQRVSAKVLENVLKDFEDRLGGLGAATPLAPTVDTAHDDAEAKKTLINLLSDPDIKKALKEAVKD